MTKTDKRVLSLTLIIVMLLAILNPVIVSAAETAPEDAIEFQDQALFEALERASVYDEEENKYVKVDRNEDGYITKAEMEALTDLSIYVYYNEENITNLDDLKYAKNLKTLTVSGIDESVSEYDLTSFTNLESFLLNKNLDTYNLNYDMDKSSVKTSDDMFVFDYNSMGTSYTIYGKKLPSSVEVEVNNVYDDPILAMRNGTGDNKLENVEMKIENENIAKFTGKYNTDEYIQGVSGGTTTVTYKSDFSTITTTINVIKSSINGNQPLEETGVTAKLAYDRIILSNGDLYKVKSKTEVVKEDTNVSDFVYTRDGSQKTALYFKLKGDNSLNIKGYISDKQTSVDIKEMSEDVSNVKYILFDKYLNEAGYLTNDGTVYKVTLNRDDDNITMTKVATGVSKAEGAFYVKDGSTYSIDGKLELNEEFDQAVRNTFSVGNKLYERRYNNGEYVATLVAEDFASYTDYRYWETMYVSYITTTGEVKDTVGSSDYENNKFEYHSLFGNKFDLTINKDDTLCWGEVKYLTDVSDVILINKTVGEYAVGEPDYLIAVRKDGTVWTKDYYTYENFTKIFTPTENDVELGNLDDDDEVTIKDVKLALQCSLSKTELSEVQIKAADVNKDGKVDIKDVKLILQYSLEKIDSFENV